LPSYTVRTASQARSLNRPYILASRHELLVDHPDTRSFAAYSTGVVAHPDSVKRRCGYMLPSGTYLLPYFQ